MDVILKKLYRGSAQRVVRDILETYQERGFAIVNFLYFANAMKFHLFEHTQKDIDIQYKKALLHGDFLLPDGIALQVWDRFSRKVAHVATKEGYTRIGVDGIGEQANVPNHSISGNALHGGNIHNLNGTDLTPLFLEYVAERYDVEMYIVSVYDEKIGKGPEWLAKGANAIRDRFGITSIYTYQTEYSERGKELPFVDSEGNTVGENKEASIMHTVSRSAGTQDSVSDVGESGGGPRIRVMLHCTGTPFQELWTEEHRSRYEANSMIVLNVGGFIDFISGFEKRAPSRVVKARVLETFRRIITNPKKNIKKFLVMFGFVRVLWLRLGKRNGNKI